MKCSLSLSNTPTEAEPLDTAVVAAEEVAAAVFHGRVEGEHLVVVDEGQAHGRRWRCGGRRVLIREASLRRDLHHQVAILHVQLAVCEARGVATGVGGELLSAHRAPWRFRLAH